MRKRGSRDTKEVQISKWHLGFPPASHYCSMKSPTSWPFFLSSPFWCFTSVLTYCSAPLTSLLYNNHYALLSVPFTECCPLAMHLSHVTLCKCCRSRCERFLSQTLDSWTKERVCQFDCTFLSCVSPYATNDGLLEIKDFDSIISRIHSIWSLFDVINIMYWGLGGQVYCSNIIRLVENSNASQ